jgi:hypothetical protein
MLASVHHVLPLDVVPLILGAPTDPDLLRPVECCVQAVQLSGRVESKSLAHLPVVEMVDLPLLPIRALDESRAFAAANHVAKPNCSDHQRAEYQ